MNPRMPLGYLGIVLLLLLSFAACGWGYASKTYKPKPEEPVYLDPPGPSPEVLAATQKDPCQLNSFMVFFVEENSRRTKEVQCETGRTINMSRAALTAAEFRTARMDNIPIGQWYVLVDPQGTQRAAPGAISNEELLGLSRVYELSYHQRQPSTGLILYLFEAKKGASR